MTAQLSPEGKAILREYVRKQREKYGDDWKRIKAEEMTEQTMPAINRLLDVFGRKNPGGTGG